MSETSNDCTTQRLTITLVGTAAAISTYKMLDLDFVVKMVILAESNFKRLNRVERNLTAFQVGSEPLLLLFKKIFDLLNKYDLKFSADHPVEFLKFLNVLVGR